MKRKCVGVFLGVLVLGYFSALGCEEVDQAPEMADTPWDAVTDESDAEPDDFIGSSEFEVALDEDDVLDVPDTINAPTLEKMTVGESQAAYGRATFQVCVKYQPDYEDVGGGEDWWTSNAAQKARGIRIRITLTTNSLGDDLYYGYVSRDTGCTPTMWVSSTGRYNIRAYSQAKVSPTADNFIYVRKPTGSYSRYWKYLAQNVSPGMKTYTWVNNSKYSEDVVNIAAAAGYSVNKRYGGLSGESFHIYNARCEFDPNQGSCYEDDAGANLGLSTPDALFISPSGRERKFIIAHEVGHAVGAKRESPAAEPDIASWSDPTCGELGSSSHELTSKEYQSTAAKEGFAHFYAASVWNDSADTRCWFGYYKRVDHDLDGTPTNNPWVSCENGGDYLDDAGCAADGFGTEYDWMRFWWDIFTDVDISFGKIADVWDRANSHTWNDVPDPSDPNNNPYERIRNGFYQEVGGDSYLMGRFDVYANYNGVNR